MNIGLLALRTHGLATRANLAAVLLLYALTIVLRSPAIVLTPSFWAEEGTYFAFALKHGWVESLLQTPVQYLSLWTNIACTVAAILVPLEFAPMVTMLFAFAVQMVPAAIIVTSGSEIWERPANKFFGLLFTLIALPGRECWLNTINSQFYFGLIAVLILLEPEDLPRKKRLFFRSLLLVAGLTGPVAIILFPVYFWVMFRDRSREKAIQVSILFLSVILQTACLASGWSEGGVERVGKIDLYTVVAIVWTRMMLVFTGPGNSITWSALLIETLSMVDKYREMMLSLLILAEAVLFTILAMGIPRRIRTRLFSSFILFIFIGIMFSTGKAKTYLISPLINERYFYLPNVLVLFMTIAAANVKEWGARKLILAVPLLFAASAIFYGAKQYHDMGPRYQSQYPAWKTEVARWKADIHYPLGIWPAGWTIELGSDVNQ